MDRTETEKRTTDFRKLLFAAAFFVVAFLCILALRQHRKDRYPTITLTDMSALPLTGMEYTWNGRFEATDEDGFVEITGLDCCVESLELYCKWISRKPSLEPGTMQIYYNTGSGYSEDNSVRVRIKNGSCRATLDTRDVVRTLRLDLFDVEGNSVTVDRIVLNPGIGGNLPVAAAMAAVFLAVLCVLSRFTDFAHFAVLTAGSLGIYLAGTFPAVYYCNPQLRDEYVILSLLALAVYAVVLVMPEGPKKRRVFTAVLMAAGFVLYYTWAGITPLGQGPDEGMHYDVVDFITTYKTIPRGDDPRIRNVIWGFSYAFNPILPFMIGAFFQTLVMPFISETFELVMAARMVSILAGAGTIFFVSYTADMLFPEKKAGYVLPVFIAFYPELAFMFTYVNSDGFAIFTTAMIVYFWVLGMKNSWRIRDGVGLSLAMGLCALTYYNCYGFILMSIPMFFFSIFRTGRSRAYIARLTALIVFLTFAVCGWWFIRNAIIYDGDFLGRSALNRTAELYAWKAYRPSNIPTPKSEGHSIAYMLFEMDWLKNTYYSFINVFSHLTLPGRVFVRKLYTGCFAAGFVGVCVYLVRRVRRRGERTAWETQRTVLHINLFFAMVIPFGLALIYSYVNDFQPQGRYILPCAVPLGYFLAAGFGQLDDCLDSLKSRLGSRAGMIPDGVVCCGMMAIWTAVIINSFLDTVFPYYV